MRLLSNKSFWIDKNRLFLINDSRKFRWELSSELKLINYFIKAAISAGNIGGNFSINSINERIINANTAK